ncbi:MAG: cyclic nucleotide-binding domain-containing protein [Bacteroidota bacterium]
MSRELLSVFDSLSEKALSEILQISSTINLTKKHLVLEPDKYSNDLFLVLKGSLKQYYLKEEKEVVFRLIVEDEFCCSAYTLITGGKTFEYIETTEETTLLRINYQKLSQLYNERIDVANLGRRLAEQYFVHEQDRLLSIVFKTPQERYLAFMQKNGSLVQRFPLGTIASFLGMTQETLSRLRAKRF